VIEVVDVMGDDLAVANAARVSFNKWKDNFDDKDAKLITYLASHEHSTPFRHPQISIRCSAPVFLARQLGKHQVGLTWNEVSRRYVDDEPEFYFPYQWRARPDGSVKQGSGNTEITHIPDCLDFINQDGGSMTVHNYYKSIIKNAKGMYEQMLEAGIAPEMARMILPQSMMTTWVWTGSLLAFFHVWRLRSEAHAQVEAQDFAKELDTIMMELFPVSWGALKEAV